MHIGIIPDGNRRYAEKMKISLREGYTQGIENFISLAKHSFRNYKEINKITIYALSMENFYKRDKKELSMLWDLFTQTIDEMRSRFNKFNVFINFIGDYTLYPEEFREKIKFINSSVKTQEHTYKINILLCYLNQDIGDEIDLVIRTGNRYSLSGFCPLNTRFSELRFRKELFPEYTLRMFDEDIKWFYKQRRLFGG